MSVQVEWVVSVVKVVLLGTVRENGDMWMSISTHTTRKSSTCIESAVTSSWSPAPMPTPSGTYPVGFWCTANSVDIPFKGS